MVVKPRSHDRAADKTGATGKGLRFEPAFCPAGVADPFDTVVWEERAAQIRSEGGDLVFEQTGVAVPSTWSQLATNVVVSKYFYGEIGTPERESSARQLIDRVAGTIAAWGWDAGYFAHPTDRDAFGRDLAWLCLHQHASFNSPVWFNVGLFDKYGIKGSRSGFHWSSEERSIVRAPGAYEYPQVSACFIQAVEDSMEGIMRLATSEAMLFKFGSGTGTDLTPLRSMREKLAGGGKPSGPLSFMKVYDQIAAVIKSGGKTRRAAKMQSLKITHPDVLEFIEAKRNEEAKAHALIKQGYEANFNGEAYSSVFFQNANLSVRVNDDFMKAVEADADWATRWVTEPEREGPSYKARFLLQKIAEGTWQCGDPGLQYDTTINNWHTCPAAGRINASNPCVTGDTLVATDEGWRRIEFLVGRRGVHIIGADGRPHPVDRIFPTGTKPVFRLRTRSGYEVRITGDHKVWTRDRGDVAVRELKKGDQLRLEMPGFGRRGLPEGLAAAIGVAAGDGCLVRSHTTGRVEEIVILAMAPEEIGVLERVAAAVNEEKRLRRAVGAAGRPDSVSATFGREARTARLAFLSQPVVSVFKELAVLDQGSTGKRFTDAVFDLDRPSLAALLQGLFTAGGTVAKCGDKSQYVSLDSSSLELIQQVQLLLLGFGIKSKLYVGRRGGRREAWLPDGRGGARVYPVQEMHSLRVSRSSRVLFEKEIGFDPASPKAAALRLLNSETGVYLDQLLDEVRSVEPLGEEPVFDLTEEATSHFVANGLVVHNCSEYMFLDNSACNLASLNLLRFRREDGTFDVERYRKAVRVMIAAQEIVVDHGGYPTSAIAENSHNYRPLGLGYTNLGALLMASGLPYDSDEGRALCGALTALTTGQAYLTSSEIAAAAGPFTGYAANREPMLGVMAMHRAAIENIDPSCPDYLLDAARTVWDECIASGRAHGYRNAQATVIAPTGTISFMMDCDTTGIEPDLALVKYKQLAGGGMLKIVNQTVPLALEALGYEPEARERIWKCIEERETVEGCIDLKTEHLPVFDCAFPPKNGKRSIDWRAHGKMMAAAQPFVSGAISKTVNMPRESSVEDIVQAYIDGWHRGLKALAIYRDGSKESQPLSTASEGQKQATAPPVGRPFRKRLPDTRASITHKFAINNHEGYITVGLYKDGSPGELFITMAKEGSTIGGLMDVLGTLISMSLQYGVPLDVLVNKFAHSRFEPSGWTSNPDIPMAKSLVDYIFRWLGIQFIPGYKEKNAPQRNLEALGTSALPAKAGGTAGSAPGGNPAAGKAGGFEAVIQLQMDAPLCDNCGALTVRSGMCYLCYNCGSTSGCG